MCLDVFHSSRSVSFSNDHLSENSRGEISVRFVKRAKFSLCVHDMAHDRGGVEPSPYVREGLARTQVPDAIMQ